MLLDSLPPEAYQGSAVDEATFSAIAPRLLREAAGLEQTSPSGTAASPSTIADVVELVRRPEWTDAIVAQVAAQLTVMLLNAQALAHHVPVGSFDGPTAIIAAGGPRSPVFDALGMGRATAWDWRTRLTGPVWHTAVPGDHYSFIRSGVSAAARAFDTALSEAVLGVLGPAPRFRSSV